MMTLGSSDDDPRKLAAVLYADVADGLLECDGGWLAADVEADVADGLLG